MTCEVEKENEELKKLVERLRETIREKDLKLIEVLRDFKDNQRKHKESQQHKSVSDKDL